MQHTAKKPKKKRKKPEKSQKNRKTNTKKYTVRPKKKDRPISHLGMDQNGGPALSNFKGMDGNQRFSVAMCSKLYHI